MGSGWRAAWVRLWRQHMPAAEQLAWWMGQLAPASGSERRLRLAHQRPRLYALCSVEYIELVAELLGPVAGEGTAQNAHAEGDVHALHQCTRCHARACAPCTQGRG